MSRLDEIKKWMKEKQLDHTLYCSVVAHCHRKLHMKKINQGTLSWVLYNIWKFTGGSRTDYWDGLKNLEKNYGLKMIEPERYMYEWTMELQQLIVNKIVEVYEEEKKQ